MNAGCRADLARWIRRQQRGAVNYLVNLQRVAVCGHLLPEMIWKSAKYANAPR
jgi:hypothetical protein